MTKIQKLKEEITEYEEAFELYNSAVNRGTEIFRKIHPEFPKSNYPDTGQLVNDLCNRIVELEAQAAQKNIKRRTCISDIVTTNSIRYRKGETIPHQVYDLMPETDKEYFQ